MNWIRPAALKSLGILGMNRRNVDYIGAYNHRSNYPLVDNKLKTKLMAQKMGLTLLKCVRPMLQAISARVSRSALPSIRLIRPPLMFPC